MFELHIYQHGGIGDQIVGIPFINLFKDRGFKVTLYTKFKEVASIFLDWVTIKNREEFLKTSPPTFWIELIDIVKINCANKHIIPHLPPMLQKIFYAHEARSKVWGRLISGHPGTCNGVATLAVSQMLNRNNLCFHLINEPYKRLEFDIEGMPGEFITCHDGFDSSHNFELSTKSWNIDKFAEVVKKIKERFPALKVIQLGGIKHRPIKYVDLNLAGQISFKDSLRYLKSSKLHIDGDSGLVHARAVFKKPSIVLFGPTNVDYFGYEENANFSPKFCGDCFWMKYDWMKKCPKDFPMEKASACMDSVDVNHVVQYGIDLIKDQEQE